MASNAEREEAWEEGGESAIDFADNQERLKRREVYIYTHLVYAETLYLPFV